jgi:hypothetical protein
MARIVSALFLLVGLAAVGSAAYLGFAPPAGPALVVPETEIHVPECTPGQAVGVMVRLENTSGRPIRVLGLVPC